MRPSSPSATCHACSTSVLRALGTRCRPGIRSVRHRLRPGLPRTVPSPARRSRLPSSRSSRHPDRSPVAAGAVLELAVASPHLDGSGRGRVASRIGDQAPVPDEIERLRAPPPCPAGGCRSAPRSGSRKPAPYPGQAKCHNQIVERRGKTLILTLFLTSSGRSSPLLVCMWLSDSLTGGDINRDAGCAIRSVRDHTRAILPT